MVPVSGMTIAGGLFLNTDAKSNVYGVKLSGNNIAAVAAIGKASIVDYAAWYAKVSQSDLGVSNGSTYSGTTAGANAINLNLKAPVGPVSIEVNYAKVDYSLNNAAKTALNVKDLSPTQSRIVVSGDVSGISLAAGYVKAGKDGGDVTLGDTDSTSNFVMKNFSGTALTNTSAIYLSASMPVGPVTAKLEYGKTSDVDGAVAGDTKFSETKLSASYAISKKLSVSAWMTDTSGGKIGATDYSKLGQNRIELSYTF